MYITRYKNLSIHFLIYKLIKIFSNYLEKNVTFNYFKNSMCIFMDFLPRKL